MKVFGMEVEVFEANGLGGWIAGCTIPLSKEDYAYLGYIINNKELSKEQRQAYIEQKFTEEGQILMDIRY